MVTRRMNTFAQVGWLPGIIGGGVLTLCDVPVEMPLLSDEVADSSAVTAYFAEAQTDDWQIGYVFAYFLADLDARHRHDFQFAAFFRNVLGVRHVFLGQHYRINHSSKFDGVQIDALRLWFDSGSHVPFISHGRPDQVFWEMPSMALENFCKLTSRLTSSALDDVTKRLAAHRVTLPWLLNDERIMNRARNDHAFKVKHQLENEGAGLIWNDPDKFIVVAKDAGVIK